MALVIKPEHLNSPAKFLFQRLRLVNHIRKEHPSILDMGKILSTRWGGPFFDEEENDKKVEWIKVQNFFPFQPPSPVIGAKKQPC